MTNKEKLKSENYLCTLATGREVYKGDSVYRTAIKIDGIAHQMYIDRDGDRYLVFEDGGLAWVDGPLNDRQQMLR